MAGVSRLQYTTEIRLIRVMCSGRVDLEFILRAFLNGVDGVFIGGCRLKECNYTTHGNYHALNLVLLAKKIMAHVGLNPDRLMIGFMSSGEGMVFAEAVDGFVEKIKGLKALGQSEGIAQADLNLKLQEIQKLVPYIKINKREKLETPLENPDQYEGLFTPEEIDTLFKEVVSYYIDPQKCRACMICAKRCPVDAISGGKNRIHIIDQEACIKCGTCFEACPERFNAVREITGQPVPPPIPEAERTLVRKAKK